MHTISPWSITAQTDIDNSTALISKEICNYIYEVYNCDDSVWIVVIGPKKERMAFRAAFAINSSFEVEDLIKNENDFRLNLKTELGEYEITIDFPETESHLLHFKTTLKLNKPLLIPFWPRDILPLTDNGNIENTNGKIHLHQVGTRSGILYASIISPKKSNLFYFQNLTSISDYCEATKTSLAETVGGTWPEIGFQLPAAIEEPLPAGKHLPFQMRMF